MRRPQERLWELQNPPPGTNRICPLRLAPQERTLGQAAWAARLLAAAEAIREEIGAPRPFAEEAGYSRDMSTVWEALGEDAFAAAWAEGRAMTLEQAIEYGLGGES